MDSEKLKTESEKSLTFFTSEKPAEDAKTPVLLGEGGASGLGWSNIEAFLRCPKEYQFKIIRKISAPIVETPDAYAVGGLFHAGRATWFASNFSSTAWPDVREAVRLEATKWPLPITKEAETRALDLLLAYMNHYVVQEHPRPIAAEYLLDATQLSGDLTERTTRLDDISFYPEANGQLCIGEAKTTSESISECMKQYRLHGQIMLQALLWKLHPAGEKTYGPIMGAMLDVVKKPYGKKRPDFGRQLIPITDHQLKWFTQSLSKYLRDSATHTWNTDAQRNVHSCTRLVSGRRIDCQYKPLCIHGRDATSQYVLADGTPLSAWKPTEGKEAPPWE